MLGRPCVCSWGVANGGGTVRDESSGEEISIPDPDNRVLGGLPRFFGRESSA